MKSLEKHLKEKLKNKKFAKGCYVEKRLLDLSLKIVNERNKKGLTQKELSKTAKISQQHLSKIESGSNCNMITFLKVCDALELKINVRV
jgi:HTH-type transcriptional regulator / antitoxin HipB